MTLKFEDKCPVCSENTCELDCDEVDVGVGVIQGNWRGLCKNCGEMYLCDCGAWVGQAEDGSDLHKCKELR